MNNVLVVRLIPKSNTVSDIDTEEVSYKVNERTYEGLSSARVVIARDLCIILTRYSILLRAYMDW
jgi:hypothetical protein